MWQFSGTGFVSAVSNGKDLMVRARDRESLEPIAESTKTEVVRWQPLEGMNLRIP